MTGRHRAAGHSRRSAAVASCLFLALGVSAVAISQGVDTTQAAPVPTPAAGDQATPVERERSSSVTQRPARAPGPAHRIPDDVVLREDVVQAVTPIQDRSEDLRALSQLSTRVGGDTPTSPHGVATDGIDRPARLTAPDIGVESVLQPLGLNDDGSLEVPAPGPRYDHAGWFTGSPRPGEVGPAVLLGHVNGAGGAPSVFYRLAELRPGQRVSVVRDDGSEAWFEVYLVEQHPKSAFPTAAVYGDTTGPELRLITCAGSWDPGTGHYRDNTVVYARVVPGP